MNKPTYNHMPVSEFARMGGKARAKTLSKAQRIEHARKMSKARKQKILGEKEAK